jgi:hypothetical protein
MNLPKIRQIVQNLGKAQGGQGDIEWPNATSFVFAWPSLLI